MNILKTALVQVLLLSGSLLAEENNEKPVDDDDPDSFPERLRSLMLRSAWQSEPIPVIPLPQGVKNQEGNHPDPEIPPPPPQENDESSDESQPPPPPPIPPPPTEEETTTEADANAVGDYWYYTETPQTEPPTTAYNWWSYNNRLPYVETTTQPQNNFWYNYYTTRKPTTFSWINWNSFTLSPTTTRWYWQAPAAGSPVSHDDLTVTDSMYQDFETTEESQISSTLKPKVTESKHNSKFTRPSQGSWQFWDNIPRSTAKYSWRSSGDASMSSKEFPWKHINVSNNSLSSKLNDTYKLIARLSNITSNVHEVSTLPTDSQTLYSTDRTSVRSELVTDVTIRPPNIWLESKPNNTHTSLDTRHIWNVISRSQSNLTPDISSERTSILQEINSEVVKNDAIDSGISDTLYDKTNHSVFSGTRETVTLYQGEMHNSSIQSNESEQLPLKYLYNIGESTPNVKYGKETLIHQNVSMEGQHNPTPVSNVAKQREQIKPNITPYSQKPWTFWKNSVKPHPNIRYYWYSPEDYWLKTQLKSSDTSLQQLSKQTDGVTNTVPAQKNIYFAKSKVDVGFEYNTEGESKFPDWKYMDTLNKEQITEKLEEVINDSTESTEVKSHPESQNETYLSAKYNPEVNIRSQSIGLDSKSNRTSNWLYFRNFWNSTSNSTPKPSYKWYSTNNAGSSASKYSTSSHLVDRHGSVSGVLSPLLTEERNSGSAINETEIKSLNGSEFQFHRNSTPNFQSKFRYDWYSKANRSNDGPDKEPDKSTHIVSKDTLTSETNDTILPLSRLAIVNSEEDSIPHLWNDSTLETIKSPIERQKYWYTSGKSPESYKYRWESSNGKTLHLTTERSTTTDLEKGWLSTISSNSELINSTKEAKSQFNELWLNSDLSSTRPPTGTTKSQAAIHYYWYSPNHESNIVNVKSFQTSSGSALHSPTYITQKNDTNLSKIISEEHQTYQQRNGSHESKRESTRYSPITSKLVYTLADTHESRVGLTTDSKFSQMSSNSEDVHLSPSSPNFEVTVRPPSASYYSKSNSSHILFTSRNNTSKPQSKYRWYAVGEVTQKVRQ